MSQQHLNATCCVVGGGPAGMMVGFLLARAGIDVLVIEKHADFFRDFRGDTVHPSTLELMHELGLLEEFLRLPHQEVKQVVAQIGCDLITFADFSRIHAECKFIAFLPQWDFLDFLAKQAQRYRPFRLKMNTEATELIEHDGQIVGVKAVADGHEVEISSRLVIGADGRSSVVRQAAGLAVRDIGAPMDVLWFKLPRLESDPVQTMGKIGSGAILIMLNRGDYWQCGLVIPKGCFDQVLEQGLAMFRGRIESIAPFLSGRTEIVADWQDVKLLTVKVDRLSQWHRQGLLCIGDSAHAMSPVGGVGINLAIQDAVAAANILWRPLSLDHCSDADLAAVQERRSYPTKMTQWLQVCIQNKVISPTLTSAKIAKAPFGLKIFNQLPILRTIPANIIGVGFRPEHIRCPDKFDS